MKVGDLVIINRSVWPESAGEPYKSYIGVILKTREDDVSGYTCIRYNVFFPDPPCESWNSHFWNITNLNKVTSEV